MSLKGAAIVSKDPCRKSGDPKSFDGWVEICLPAQSIAGFELLYVSWLEKYIYRVVFVGEKGKFLITAN